MSSFPELEKLVEDIKHLSPLQVSQETEALIDYTVNHYYQEDDIEKWAEKLASDVVEAGD